MTPDEHYARAEELLAEAEQLVADAPEHYDMQHMAVIVAPLQQALHTAALTHALLAQIGLQAFPGQRRAELTKLVFGPPQPAFTQPPTQ